MQSLTTIESAEVTREIQDHIKESGRTISELLERLPDLTENYIAAVKERDGIDLIFPLNLDLFNTPKGQVEYQISKILTGKIQDEQDDFVATSKILIIIFLYYRNISNEKTFCLADIQKFLALEKILSKIQLIFENVEIETDKIWRDHTITQNIFSLKKWAANLAVTCAETFNFIIDIINKNEVYGLFIDDESYIEFVKTTYEEKEKLLLAWEYIDEFKRILSEINLIEYFLYLSCCIEYLSNFVKKEEYHSIEDLESLIDASKKAMALILAKDTIAKDIAEATRLNKSTNCKREQKDRKKTEIIKHLEAFPERELLTLNKISETLAPKLGNSAKAVTNYIKEMTGGQIPPKHKFSGEALLKLIKTTTPGR